MTNAWALAPRAVNGPSAWGAPGSFGAGTRLSRNDAKDCANRCRFTGQVVRFLVHYSNVKDWRKDDTMAQGTIKTIRDDKGFGFIGRKAAVRTSSSTAAAWKAPASISSPG